MRHYLIHVVKQDGSFIELYERAKSPDDAIGRATDKLRIIKERDRVTRCVETDKPDPQQGAA